MGKLHKICDVFYGRNLLEGAAPKVQDDGTFMIMNATLIKAGTSSNGNFYPESTLQKAAKLYEGKQIRTDHPSLLSPPSVKDIIGDIPKAWWSKESKAIKANVRFSSTAEDILIKVREGFIGDLSHNARGETEQEKAPNGGIRRRVKSIEQVYSVDLICEAAAGGTLHEEHRQTLLTCERMRDKMNELADLTLEELVKSRPDLAEAIAKDAVAKVDVKEKKKDDDKTLTVEDIQTVVQESVGGIFKERDKLQAEKDAAAALIEAFDEVIDKTLSENDADDEVKDLVRGSLVAFAKRSFKSIDAIDNKRLSEERDALFDKLGIISKKYIEWELKESKGGKPKKGGGPDTGKRLMDHAIL